MPSLSLPYDPKRVAIAGVVVFCFVVAPLLLLTALVSGLLQWLVLAGVVVLWATLTRKWVRRTSDTESNIWGAVSRSQALGRYAESGGITVTEQRDSLSDDEE